MFYRLGVSPIDVNVASENLRSYSANTDQSFSPQVMSIHHSWANAIRGDKQTISETVLPVLPGFERKIMIQFVPFITFLSELSIDRIRHLIFIIR